MEGDGMGLLEITLHAEMGWGARDRATPSASQVATEPVIVDVFHELFDISRLVDDTCSLRLSRYEGWSGITMKYVGEDSMSWFLRGRIGSVAAPNEVLYYRHNSDSIVFGWGVDQFGLILAMFAERRAADDAVLEIMAELALLATRETMCPTVAVEDSNTCDVEVGNA